MGVLIAGLSGLLFGLGLIAGGLLFGIGWGLAGFCPGPALVAMASPGSDLGGAGIFVLAMLTGMMLHDRLFTTA